MNEERPIRVWKYRGWCFICRVHKVTGHSFPSQQAALQAAMGHCKRRRNGG